ncbi:MAG: HEPN domain-containing protein [Deltaproteobacteria bacterium]|nr:HEPN domain-containing protein [Deltaproteobacteria bacterium]
MTDDNRRVHVAAEVALGDGSLQAAALLLDAGLLPDAASRAYYAAHHYARAALLTLGLEARSHQGLRSLFGQHLVKAGHVPAALSRALAHLQRDREDADYDRSFALDRSDAEALVASAREFVATVRGYLDRGGWLAPPAGSQ